MTPSAQSLTVKDLKAMPLNEFFDTVLLVRKVSSKISRNGKAFLQVEVGDKTDNFCFNCFEGGQPFAFFKNLNASFPQVIQIKGQTENYGERLSPRIKEVLAIGPDTQDLWLDKLLEKPQESIEALREELSAYLESIAQESLRATVAQVFEDVGEAFINSVAAVSMHHGYLHGLLEHTVHVTRAAVALLPLYPEINRDLVISGALLHDIGKVLEYRYASIDGIERTTLGRLQGHVVLGYRLVRSAALRHHLESQLLERLEHIVLSHQGEPEWGAAVFPSTPEAVFVSLIDNLDAKLGMVQQQLRKAMPQQPFSDFVPGLQTRLCTLAITE